MTATAAPKSGLARLFAWFIPGAHADGQHAPNAVPPPKMLRYQFDPKRVLTPEEVAITFKLLHLTVDSDTLRSADFPDFMREHFRPVLIDRNKAPTK